MRVVLGSIKLATGELLAFQEQAEDPKEFIPDVEIRLFDFILSTLVSIPQ